MNKAQEIRLGQYISWAFLCFHSVVFLGINALLIISNKLVMPETPWFVIPLSFWGMILLAHVVLHFVVLSQQASNIRSAQAKGDKLAVMRFFFWMAFYCHGSVYVLSSIMMFILNYLISPTEYWSLIVAVSWGAWVLLQYVLTLIIFVPSLKPWRDRKRAELVSGLNGAESVLLHLGRLRFGFWLAYQLHIGLYLVTMIFLTVLDIIYAGANHWFQYPLLGWGIIVAAHWLMTKLILARRIDLA